MLTKQHYKMTAETLRDIMKEFPETETDTYTVDFIIEKLISFMEYRAWYDELEPSHEEDYERAMKGIG